MELENDAKKAKGNKMTRRKNFIKDRLRFFNPCCSDKVRLNQDLVFLRQELCEKCDKYKIWTNSPITTQKTNEYLSILSKPIGVFDAKAPKKKSKYVYSSQNIKY